MLTFLRILKSKLLGDKFFTTDFIDPKYHQNIGEFTYGNPRIIDWGDGGSLKIGKFCSIAGGATIMLGGHHQYLWITTYPFPSRKDLWPEAKKISGQSFSLGDVTIGNDVMLGQDCLILSGVTIGDGAVIGARAVVRKRVPPYAIVSGNPGVIMGYRFNKQTIEKLLKINWWNWSEEKIRKGIPELCSQNMGKFLEKYDKK